MVDESALLSCIVGCTGLGFGFFSRGGLLV